MKIKLKQLNSRGFAHHLLIPLLAIIVIAGIGAYVVTKPKAMTLPPGGSWHTVKIYSGPFYNTGPYYKSFRGQTYTVSANRTYRVCMDAKTEGSYTINSQVLAEGLTDGWSSRVDFTSTSRRVCTYNAYKGTAYTTFPMVSNGNSTGANKTLKITQFTWQQYY